MKRAILFLGLITCVTLLLSSVSCPPGVHQSVAQADTIQNGDTVRVVTETGLLTISDYFGYADTTSGSLVQWSNCPGDHTRLKTYRFVITESCTSSTGFIKYDFGGDPTEWPCNGCGFDVVDVDSINASYDCVTLVRCN
jgi:hypothetical protein